MIFSGMMTEFLRNYMVLVSRYNILVTVVCCIVIVLEVEGNEVVEELCVEN